VLSTFTFSSLNRDGYQQRIPYPTSTFYVTDPPNTFGNGGTDTFSTQGGQGENVLRSKIQWKAADKVNVTFTADWTHIDESSVPESLLATITGPQAGVPASTALFGEFYNLCIARKIRAVMRQSQSGRRESQPAIRALTLRQSIHHG
jgi:hypothetical protein